MQTFANPVAYHPFANSAMKPQSKWILHPVIDLMFSCGGVLWILIACHFAFHWHVRNVSDGPGVLAGSMAALVGVVFLSDAHNAASWFRLYGNSKIRGQHPLVAYVIPSVLVGLATLSLFWPLLLSVGLRIYLICIAQHLTAQSYGMCLIYCRKAQYTLSRTQRNALKLFFTSVMAFAMVQQLSTPKFMSIAQIDTFAWLSLPAWCLAVAQLALVLSSGHFIMQILVSGIRHGRLVPFSVLMIAATTVAVFLFSQDMLPVVWLYVPTFFHGSQYLVINIATNLKERHERGSNLLVGALCTETLVYWLWLAVAGVAVYIGIPVALSHLGFNIITAFNALFWAANLYHFSIDAVIWKSNGPSIKALFSS